MKVYNMINSNGKKVPNQFIFEGVPAGIPIEENFKLRSGKLFQSYETAIAFIDHRGAIYLDRDSWDYSSTTGKYRNQFLGMDKKETEKKIDSGEITLVKFQ